MTEIKLSPFETILDPEFAIGQLRKATSGADDGELFLERRRSEALVFDDGRLKTASYDASEGFGLRAVRGEVSGYAHSSEISEAALSRAVETARLAVGEGGGTMADGPVATNRRLYTDEDPIAGAPCRSRSTRYARSTLSPATWIRALCRSRRHWRHHTKRW